MELETCRREIDRLDQELTKLLEERMKIVAQVAAYKKEHHLEIYDPRRERAVLDKIAGLAADKDLAPYLQTIYRYEEIRKEDENVTENEKKDDEGT